MLRDAGFAGVEKLKLFDLAEFPHEGGTVTISRTGFTGDLGYELFVASDVRCRCGTGCSRRAHVHGIRAIGYHALNRARIEAGLIVANADFVTAEHAIRADRLRMPDEIGLGFMIDAGKPHFNGRRAIFEARAQRFAAPCAGRAGDRGQHPGRARHRLSQQEARGRAGQCRHLVADGQEEHRHRQPDAAIRRYRSTDDLWVEIYAMRELQYQKLMKRARIVPRPFIKLDRRSANPPADF